MLKQLIHNGVVVPPMPPFLGLYITIKGRRIDLNHAQEEMALAWAKKKDTPYVEDPVFQGNFCADFCEALGLNDDVEIGDFDFSQYYAVVDAEREAKAALPKEERKAQAAERRLVREEMKAKYGHAIVNGQRIELGTYLTEPSGIFMGRGQHPLRGRWKAGAKQSDIVLNLSPDAPRPEGDWKEIVWKADSLWVARWKDKLTGKLKYIWFSDTAPIKQEREAAKFDKALKLQDSLAEVRAAIQEGLVAEDVSQRRLATACYLIDTLCLRVGDEKEADEADTVGATTLRPEHITINDDGSVDFHFLGKDSVEWRKTISPPTQVVENLAYLQEHAQPSRNATQGESNPTRDLPQLFYDISSTKVNKFLQGIMPGLSAKVFRTYHASMAVQDSLDSAGVTKYDPEFKKWHAASLANLAAAELCNHTKQYNGNWARSKERYQERQRKARERIAKYRQQTKDYRAKQIALREEAKAKIEAAKGTKRSKSTRERYAKRKATAAKRVQGARDRRKRAEIALGKIRAQYQMADKKRTWNLGTSLKSYIDPRIYHAWGQSVDYDVLNKYYTATLRRKYIWVRAKDGANGELGVNLTIRSCMASDLVAVSHLFEAAGQPLEPEAIAATYLPSLDKSWREAIVAIGDDDQASALAVLGPAHTEDETLLLDLQCIVRPEDDTPELAGALAAEIVSRFDAFQVGQPRRKQYILQPQETAWMERHHALAEMLGLIETETDESSDS